MHSSRLNLTLKESGLGVNAIIGIATPGGIIPEQDYEFLYNNNISAIFGPGSNIIESAEKVIELIIKKNN